MTSSNGNIFRITGLLCGKLWENNHETGDLRHHHTHYDFIAMDSMILSMPFKHLILGTSLGCHEILSPLVLVIHSRNLAWGLTSGNGRATALNSQACGNTALVPHGTMRLTQFDHRCWRQEGFVEPRFAWNDYSTLCSIDRNSFSEIKIEK